MQPYLLFVCVKAMAAEHFDEAHRLFDLMMRSAPGAPALPRLATAIGDAETLQKLAQEAQKEEAQEQARTQETPRAEAADAPDTAVHATSRDIAAETGAHHDRQEPHGAAASVPPHPGVTEPRP